MLAPVFNPLLWPYSLEQVPATEKQTLAQKRKKFHLEVVHNEKALLESDSHYPSSQVFMETDWSFQSQAKQ